MSRTLAIMLFIGGFLIGSALGGAVGYRGHVTVMAPVCHQPLGTDKHVYTKPDQQRL